MSEVKLEKASIPLHWAATIMVTVCGMAATAGVSHYRLNELEADWGKTKSALSDADKTARDHELKLQRLEITLDSMRAVLDKIDSRLERMERKDDKARR